jgi:glutamate racemase
MNVLVFDSGLGGLSVAAAVQRRGLDLRLHYLADTALFPYGDQSDAVLGVRIPLLVAQEADRIGADAVVMACNTASTLALAQTRAALPHVPVVGVVPAVKPAAALTRTGVIGLLGTPATVRRAYTDALIADHAAGITVLRHGAPDLAAAAEAVLCGAGGPGDAPARAMAGLMSQPGGDRMDVVVLACTHFVFVVEALAAAAPAGVRFIDSADAVARRLADVTGAGPGEVRLGAARTTGPMTPGLAAAFARFGFAVEGAAAPF